MKQTEIAAEDTAKTRPATWKRLIQGLVSTAVVVGIFVGVMPQIADYSDVWATIRSLSGFEAITLALVAFWNLATYWFVLVAALPGLRLREAAVHDPIDLAAHLDSDQCLLMLAEYDQCVPFINGLLLRRALGNPQTLTLKSGHYTAVFALPWMAQHTSRFLRAKGI